jgi:hypothetical protein
MYQQAVRYKQNIVLIYSNLVVVKKQNDIQVFWFKGNSLDNSFRLLNLYSIEQLFSQFFDTKSVIFDHNDLINHVKELINTNHTNLRFKQKLLQKIYNRETLLKLNFSILNQNYKETDLINGERLLFDEALHDLEKKQVLREEENLLKSLF